jgi:hypothetical protein
MSNIRQYAAQAVLYALFFIPLAYLTHAPIHKHLAQDMAVLKVAVRHAGKIVGECTTLSKEAYANLPANMKRPETCPRERSPLQLELILDGEILYADSVAASGLHSDGVSSMYRRFVIPAGAHHLELFMNDDVSAAGHTWTLQQDIELQPAQVMVANFKEGFKLH